MITDKQLYFYNSLNENQQEIIKTLAFIGNNLSASNIDNIAKELRIKQSSYESNKLFNSAEENNILHRDKWNYGRCNIDIDFLIHIIPRSIGKKAYLREINSSSYRTVDHFHKSLIECLYALVFESQEKYTEYEKFFIDYHKTTSFDTFSSVIHDVSYQPYLYKISPKVFDYQINKNFNDAVYSFIPVSESFKTFSALELHLPEIKSRVMQYKRLAAGDFSGSDDNPNSERKKSGSDDNFNSLSYAEKNFTYALKYLTQSDTKKALEFFDKGIKWQRRKDKVTLIPQELYFSFFYLIALIKTDPEKSLPVLQRVRDKSRMTNYKYLLQPLMDFTLGKMSTMDYYEVKIQASIKEKNLLGLMSFLVYFLCDLKANRPQFNHIADLITAAHKGEFNIIAYEAAYALNKMFGNEKSLALYNAIAENIDYEPILSQLARTEDWEKNLNLILGLNTRKNEPVKNRIIYHYYPEKNTIVPMQQDLKKTGWTTGRKLGGEGLLRGTVRDRKSVV